MIFFVHTSLSMHPSFKKNKNNAVKKYLPIQYKYIQLVDKVISYYASDNGCFICMCVCVCVCVCVYIYIIM